MGNTQVTQNSKTIDQNNLMVKTLSSIQTCIDNCTECHQACVRTIAHCLQKGGTYADPKHIQLLQDCTRICEVSSSFMIRQSAFHGLTCEVCAKICIACAESCDAFDSDDVMKKCAEICRKCAKSCEEMSAQH